MIITANDLKVKGVAYLDLLLKKHREVFISVRGKNKLAVLPMEEFERLKDAELDRAIRESEEDFKKGRYITETAEKHFKRLKI